MQPDTQAVTMLASADSDSSSRREADIALTQLPVTQVVQRQRNYQQNLAFTSLSLQWNTLLLALLGIATCAVVLADGKFTWQAAAWLTGQVGGVLLLAYWVRQLGEKLIPVVAVSPLLVLVGLGTILFELAGRTWFDRGLPFELVTMTALRNMVIVLAIVSVWQRFQQGCLLMSLFLALFGATSSHDLAAHVLAGLFGLGAISWLFVNHWENVRQRLRGRESSHWPRAAVILPILGVLALGVTLVAGNRQTLTALRGWLPSSGGDGQRDPYARGGVGDGEMLVAGSQRIQSFAPLDNAPFMQDDQPSLYDVFDDTYDEEMRINKVDRAIALPSELASRAREHLHHKTEQAQREFSTLRQSREDRQHSHAADLLSPALFHVSGRVPLHLRLQVYDLFDGIHWFPVEEPVSRQQLRMGTSQGKPWLLLPDRRAARDYLSSAETHALKVINFDSNVIPAPLYLHGVHIDLVDREDMFKPGPDGLVALDRDCLPSLVPIHLASRTVDERLLRMESHAFFKMTTQQTLESIPADLEVERMHQLALDWTRNARSSWDTIQAVISRLRSEYTLDPAARPASTSEPPLNEFLFTSKRGPDYQFATAAAMLLRSLGYSTRVVSGFYVNPERYDLTAGQTSVLKEDVHFWTEIRVSGGDWLTLEPTPGYTVLGPPPTWGEQLLAAVVSFAKQLLARWPIVLVVLAGLGILYRERLRLFDALLQLRWRWAVRQAPQRLPVLTVELLLKRAALCCSPKRPGMSVSRWLALLDQSSHLDSHPTSTALKQRDCSGPEARSSASSPSTRTAVHGKLAQQLIPLYERVAFGGGNFADGNPLLNESHEESRALCERCLQQYSLQWFKQNPANARLQRAQSRNVEFSLSPQANRVTATCGLVHSVSGSPIHTLTSKPATVGESCS